MHIIEYANAYSYVYSIALHKYKRTAYAAILPHLKTMIIAMKKRRPSAAVHYTNIQSEFQ
jgi:hypothetical protein